MAKPTIVFVPGCWHVPAHFDKVRRELEAADYTCVGVELPGNTPEPRKNDGSLIGIEVDIEAVREAVLRVLNSGKNATIVTHSYSSIPGTAALHDLNTQVRSAAGHSTSVIGAVIISGFLLPPGAIQILYNDLEHNEALKAVWRLKPQSYGINTSKTPDQIRGLQGVPLSYLMCENDNAVLRVVQEGTVAGFRSAGVEVHVEVTGSGHSPFLSLPEETARFVRRAAGEKIETGFRAFEEKGSDCL